MANQVLYGFQNLRDRLTERVNAVGVPVINTAIDATLAEHNRQLEAMFSLFADRTTDFKRRYKTPTMNRLQPMEELGRARPIRPAGQYDIAFPLQAGGTAWGQTYEASIRATVEDTNANMATLLLGDVVWQREHMFAALFANASWTYDDADDDVGTLTIKGLANGDSDVYAIQAGTMQGTTDTHYLAQENAIGNSDDPFPIIKTELAEHPENGGEIISLIPTGLVATTKALNGFIPANDKNIRYGADATSLTGNLDAPVPGTVIGYHDDGVWLVEWPSMPAGYIISVATQGPRPLALREDSIPELRGFNRVASRDDYPYYESQYVRKAGFGAQNRVGAVVTLIGNASYAVPTGFTSPMP